MIKYLGSKRRLVPVLGRLFEQSGARTALDAFTGTTRVAQAFKALGGVVTAVDSARYAAVFGRCYIATDATAVDKDELAEAIARLDALPGRPGYVTETFCERARYFQPHNGARIDAVRDEIASAYAGTPLEPLLLTSLIEAADRVDSTTGVQMAYLKNWARRSFRPLALRAPELLPGPGIALEGDACALVEALPPVGFAYLDPPYNQHRYTANYHVWETLVAWDAPEAYGVARKRAELRELPRSPFNSKLGIHDALRRVVEAVRADLLVLSYNDESWVSFADLVSLCRVRGSVTALAFDSSRYVGAKIGIHNVEGERVGTVGRLRNLEYLLVVGEPDHVAAATHGLEAARVPV